MIRVLLTLGLVAISCRSQADEPFTLGDVLRLSAKEQLQRGALQRPSMFLDVTASKKNLEIALVIDGTDSMGKELQSVTSQLGAFVEGILAQKDTDSNVRFALVIYRDTGSPSGKCELPVSSFTDRTDVFKEALANVRTETGKPYFNEKMDVGVYEALSKLNWTTERNDVTRWIILCGDAPPLYPGHGLEHSAEELARIANEKEIEIYPVLSISGFSSADTEKARKLAAEAEREAPAAQKFMQTLASRTGGQFMDLRKSGVVKQLLGLVKQRQTYKRQFERITQSDLSACRHKSLAEANVSIAVLPHVPLKEMTFDSDRPAVQVATELRERIRSLPGVQVTGAAKTRAAFGRSTNENLNSEAETLRAVASALDADYVIWGETKSSSERYELRTAMYNGHDGRLIAESLEAAGSNDKTALSLINRESAFKLCKSAAAELQSSDVPAEIVAVFESVGENPVVEAGFNTSIAKDLRAHRAILSGLDLLEQSLRFEKKSSQQNQGATQLKRAEKHLLNALQYEPGNAFAHLLLASCYHNLGDAEGVDDYAMKPYLHMRRAYKNRDTLGESARKEIEADYELLVNKNAVKAIRLYEQLSDASDAANAKFALRANWMLAGIFLGEWDVHELNPEIVDTLRARRHIIQILAHWEGSDEAAFYEQAMDVSGTDNLATIEVGETALATR